MAEEIAVVLRRKSENSGLGFSLLGSAGLPPIIYDILENSPAAESGKVKAGDVILKVNETDVNRFSTKEVLRCLRLSEDPIRLILKRDPAIQEKVVHLLSGPHDMCEESLNVVEPSDIVKEISLKTEDEFIEKENQINFKKPKTPRCEAFMMTGDVILNLSRAQQTTGILPKRQKKIDSLSFRYRHRKRHSSVPTSPNESNLGLRKRSLSSPTESPMVSDKVKSSATASCYSFQTGVRTSKSEDHLQCQKNSSISTVDIDIEDNIASSLNTLLDTRLDGNSIVADQSKSSDSLDMSSNTTVLRITEDHPYTVKNSKNLEERRGKHAEGEKRLSGHDAQKKGEHRKKGQFEKSSSAEKYENESSKVLEKGSPKTDRIVWTYNSTDTSSHSNSGSVSGSEHNLCFGNASTFSSSSSPQRSLSPASPTSVSSSIMSSNSNSLKKFEHPETEPKFLPSHHPGMDQWNLNTTSDVSASEAVSNISSPDYQEEITMDILNARDLVMEISDCSDSDSTLLVSDPLTGAQQSRTTSERNGVNGAKMKSRMTEKNNCSIVDAEDHKIVIQVKGPDADIEEQNSDESKEKFQPSQSGSDEDSDTESFHSFHYSQKAVDLPSAIRLANRLYYLDGFKKSDVSRHLSKNNDFSRTVAEEYLKHFTFTKDTLDTALRKFLKQFSLAGETQERERVLVHFSKRYLECNPGSFNSQDAVHTLTCALMLLNTDLHGQNISRKMTCEEFIDNLRDLNEGENFPRDILKALYHAIKNYPLEWALDDEADQVACHLSSNDKGDLSSYYGNPFLGIPNLETAIEHKKGYVMRKCCIDPNGKRTPFGKRGWKMFYCTLRDIVLYLHKDEHGFIKTQLSDNLHNAIRIHHSLATKATDYTKKEHVFRLQTADQAEYLFQTSDAKELQSWVDTINFVCASYSSPPLEGAVGSENKFQRPLLPSTQTKLSLREQLVDHEERVQELELSLERHRSDPPYRSAKSALIQNYKDKESFLQYEIKRYKAYIHILRLKLPQCSILNSPGGMEDDGELGGIVPPPVPDRRIFPSNRYNYRDVVYNSGRGDTSGPDLG